VAEEEVIAARVAFIDLVQLLAHVIKPEVEGGTVPETRGLGPELESIASMSEATVWRREEERLNEGRRRE
jgi:hypothetical protein